MTRFSLGGGRVEWWPDTTRSAGLNGPADRVVRRTVQSQSGGPSSPPDQTNSPADRVVRSPAYRLVSLRILRNSDFGGPPGLG